MKIDQRTLIAFAKAMADEEVTALLHTDRAPNRHEQEELEWLGVTFCNKRGLASVNRVSIRPRLINNVLALAYVDKIELLS